jgi:hypothetical protein
MNWLESYIDLPDEQTFCACCSSETQGDYYCSIECFNSDIE